MKLAHKVSGMATTSATGVPNFGMLASLREVASRLLAKLPEALSAPDLKTVDKAGEYIEDAEPDSAPEQMHAFRIAACPRRQSRRSTTPLQYCGRNLAFLRRLHRLPQ